MMMMMMLVMMMMMMVMMMMIELSLPLPMPFLSVFCLRVIVYCVCVCHVGRTFGPDSQQLLVLLSELAPNNAVGNKCNGPQKECHVPQTYTFQHVFCHLYT